MAHSQDFEAIYENGVLRPVHPIEGLSEHSRVKVRIASTKKQKQHPLSKCVGSISEQDAREMIDVIDKEFEKVNPSDWQ